VYFKEPISIALFIDFVKGSVKYGLIEDKNGHIIFSTAK